MTRTERSLLAKGIERVRVRIDAVAQASVIASLRSLDGVATLRFADPTTGFDGLVVLRAHADDSVDRLEIDVSRWISSLRGASIVNEVWIIPPSIEGDRSVLPSRVRRGIGDRGSAETALDALDAASHAIASSRTALARFGRRHPLVTRLGAIASEGLCLATVDPLLAIARCAPIARDRPALRDLVDQLCRMPIRKVLERRDARRFVEAEGELIDAFTTGLMTDHPSLCGGRATAALAEALAELTHPVTSAVSAAISFGLAAEDVARWDQRMRARRQLRIVRP